MAHFLSIAQTDRARCAGGFTLIEISIVLVIIGLIIGGILVGWDLMNAATIRAQVTQIEKYSTAVNTFRLKFNALPGDIADPNASAFGFATRGLFAGEGDGNGVIEGISANAPSSNFGYCISGGETAMVFVDLSVAGLIEGGFSTASPTVNNSPSGASLTAYFPAAKLGGGNYISVWSGGWKMLVTGIDSDGQNYFGIQPITGIAGCFPSSSAGNIPVQWAYTIDMKIDDGLPQSGRVTTLFDGATRIWAGSSTVGGPFTTATAGSATTCFDNSATASGTPGVGGANQHYSVEMNSGSGLNCALSFQF
jgi:prepilin-type N-terminal cleavage/methylation domain-containing protein